MHGAATLQTASIWTADTDEVKLELTELSAPPPLTAMCLLERCTVASDCNETVSSFSSSSVVTLLSFKMSYFPYSFNIIICNSPSVEHPGVAAFQNIASGLAGQSVICLRCGFKGRCDEDINEAKRDEQRALTLPPNV